MRLAVLLLATGCTRILGVHEFDPEQEPTPTTTCYGTRWQACIAGDLGAMRTLVGDLSTDDPGCAGTLRDGTRACIIAATDLVVANVQAHGSLPLVLIAHDQLTIAGDLDVGSHADRTGPGANADDCRPGTPGWDEDRLGGTSSQLYGSGGGAGGSFSTLGAGGGPAQSVFAGSGGGAGRPGAISTPGALRGGCEGTDGGVPSPAMIANGYPSLAAATGGAGGGALVLISDALELDGVINASGAGGGGGLGTTAGPRAGGGGGGGGSGGLVVIEVSMALGSGAVVAFGGGGGGGGYDLAGTRGEDGAAQQIAAGGKGAGSGGGAGGDGAAATAPTSGHTTGSFADAGAGGGGGGLGLILSTVPLANAAPEEVAP